MSLFCYEPLAAEHGTRLLNLKPAKDITAPLHASLHATQLPPDGSYEALSYTWGESQPEHELHLPEGILKITENLHEALVQFRPADKERVLWVDAVCINQKDDVEKSAQVSKMTDIYSNASTVLVWLGPSLAQSQLAMQFLSDFATKSDELGVGEVDACLWMDWPKLNGTKEEADRWLRKAISNGVPALFERAWFTRLWIVQEFTHAKKLDICCGPDRMDVISFATSVAMLIAAMKTSGGTTPELAHVVRHAWVIVRHRAQFRMMNSGSVFLTEEKSFFETTLKEFEHQECKDDKGKVYALLAFQPGPERIIPDYTKTVAEVYSELAATNLSFSTLFSAGLSRRGPVPERFDPEFNEDYLPSWVPDLRKRSQRWSPIFRNYFAASVAYLGLLGRSGASSSTARFPTVAVSHALHFDTIKRITSIGGDGFKPTTSVTASLLMFNFLRNAISSLDPGPFHITGRTFESGLATMLAGGRVALPSEADEHPLADILSLRPDIPPTALFTHLWNIYWYHCLRDGASLRAKLGALLASTTTDDGADDAPIPPTFTRDFAEPDEALAWTYHAHLATLLRKHPLLLTAGGYMGLAPPGALPGDAIALLSGHRTPFVLRRMPRASTRIPTPPGRCCAVPHVDADGSSPPLYHALLGPCYVDGIMHGELYQLRVYRERFAWINARLMPRPEAENAAVPLPADVVHLL